MKVTLTLTAEQAYTVQEALEFFARIHMSQYEVVEWQAQMDTFDETLHRSTYDRELALSYLKQAKQVIFGQDSPGAYIGIMGTNERSKIAWDIYQQLRHDISHFKFPDEPLESRGQSFNKPFVVSKQPLPTIVITDEG
jgi:hypothetical protein